MGKEKEQIKKIIQLYTEMDFDDTSKFKKMFNIKSDKAADERLDMIKEIRRKAISNINNRQFVINEYSKYISNLYFNDKTTLKENINEYIDFDNLSDVDTFIKFEMILSVIDFKELVIKHELPYIITTEDIDRIFIELTKDIEKRYENDITKINLIASIMYILIDGQGVLDSLQYHNISDIASLSEDYIYVIVGEEAYYLKFLSFGQSPINIYNKITDQKFNEKKAHVITEKENGNRVIITGYKFTPKGDTYYNERLHNMPYMSLESIRQLGTINEDIMKFLDLHVKGFGRTLISGNNTNTGKSTLMYAMIDSMPQQYGLGMLDSSDEGKLREVSPDKNIITLIASEDKDIDTLMEALFKYSRRYIGVGEIVKPVHAANLISLTKAFDSGIFSTIHSAKDIYCIDNLVDKMMRTETYSDRHIAERHAAEVIDINIHLARHKDNQNRIIVESINEVIPLHRENIINPIYGDRSKMFTNILRMGQAAIYKKVFNINYEVKNLIRYSYEKDDWIINGKLSSNYINRYSFYNRNKEALNAMNNIFN